MWENGGDVWLILIYDFKMVAGKATRGVGEHYEGQEYTSQWQFLVGSRCQRQPRIGLAGAWTKGGRRGRKRQALGDEIVQAMTRMLKMMGLIFHTAGNRTEAERVRIERVNIQRYHRPLSPCPALHFKRQQK